MTHMSDLTPPLTLDGSRILFDRRDVNMHWLAGTILTGLVGFVLMGGAFFSATGGVTRFAHNPELARLSLQGAAGQHSARKGDKLTPLSYSPVTRQAILVQMRSKQGEREIVKSRTHIRLSAPLATSRTHLTAKLPTFSQLQYIHASKEEPDKPPLRKNQEAGQDGEVSFTSRDLLKTLAAVSPPLDAPLNLTEILSTQAKTSASEGSKTATAADQRINIETSADLFISNALSSAGGTKLADVTITAANMSAISKDASDPLKNTQGEDENVIVTPGTSLMDIIVRQGIAGKDAQILAQLLMNRLPAGAWKEGLKVQFSFGDLPGPGENRLPERVRILADRTPLAVAVQSDLGHFVIIDESEDDRDSALAGNVLEEQADDTDDRVSLYYALFETGLKNDVPRGVLNEFIRIASFDLDFERKVKQGDSVEFFYAEDDSSGQKSTDTAEILYAAITLGGNTRKFYRFETPDDETIDYYDESGKSAKKFLLRKPMNGGVFRSPFGSRRHPILGYTRMHTGVDWSAPRGTPILASGNGVIEKADWQSGYGRYALIKHVNGYETGYGHMSGYAPGIVEGARVRQGQVIGYVGSTGLSTGNHLHYEVVVNGRFVDPLRIKIPQGRTLSGSILTQFERERERVDGLINRAPASTKI